MDIISAYYAKAYTFGVLVSVFVRVTRCAWRLRLMVDSRRIIKQLEPRSRAAVWDADDGLISNTCTPQGVECKWLYGLGIRGDNKSQ